MKFIIANIYEKYDFDIDHGHGRLAILHTIQIRNLNSIIAFRSRLCIL